MGRVRHASDPQEHADHRLRRREDFKPGEPQAGAAVHQARPHRVPLPSGMPDAPMTRAPDRVKHVFYLHGFTSSARSTKARYFAERLRPHGIELRCPDFNEPDFASLTMTRMLDRFASELAGL